MESLQRQMNTKGSLREPFFFAIQYDQSGGFLCAPEELSAQGIGFSIKGEAFGYQPALPQKDLQLTFTPIPYAQYLTAFQKVQKELNLGNSYLTNLTFRHPLDCNYSLEEIYAVSSAPYKMLVKGAFTLFSPEAFVTTRQGRIFTYPMKGTIDADLPDAARQILEDEKEMAEHATIVDLLRNDLNIIGKNTGVEKYRYLDALHTSRGNLLQVSSEIGSDLPEDFFDKLGDYFCALLPAGSVTGAPKKETLRIIASVEDYSRNYYTGVMGYFDGRVLSSAVMIRFIEEQEGQLYYKSGGGITIFSDPLKEYQELLQKIYVPIHRNP
jgi:para-aminobenzoate synthetase component I